MSQMPTRALGKSGLEVSAIGLGTNAWRHGTSRIAAYRALLDGGVNFIDTAEVYFWGESERAVAACRLADGRPVHVASKFMPFFGRTSPRSLLKALDATLARLGLETIDLYYVHFPFPLSLAGFADGLVEAVKSGKARAVGVSNFSAGDMRRMSDRLAKSGVALAANEVHYSLLHRGPETNGVLDACRERDVALVAYFPLARARLAEGAAEGADAKIAGLQRALAEVGQAHQATAAQAALAWMLRRDPHIIPIPGTSRETHAHEIAAAGSLSLTDEEFAAIDRASASAA
ncbi:MAG TPA: aldo/keto reductase [Caulobacteraceae bacterium]|nr:aldo/keto reductase [Caulobacteraceae bacterium]